MTSHSVTPPAGDPQVVFVYSCFRGSSTWFWSRLRAQKKFCCYYEIFNEHLERLLPADVAAVRPDNWHSHHPDGAPYLLEFAPLLGSAPGIPGFPVENPLGSRYIGRGGIEGPLDEDVREYVSQFIRHSRANGRVPVLTDPRLLARAAGFRATFGGTHILLVRNLFEQWISVCGQWRAGNDYFLRMVFHQLRYGQQDPFFAYLLSRFSVSDQVRFEDWARDANLDLVLACYVASRIYLLLRARRHCDLVVDITQLEDAGYRTVTEKNLADYLGADIALGNFERRVDYPKRFVQSPRDCRQTMAGLVERALTDADANADESAFAHELLDGVWRVQEEFMAYTAGARELIEGTYASSLEARLGEVEREHARYVASAQAALAESTEYAGSLEARISREATDARMERDALQAAHREASRYADSLKQAHEESQKYAKTLEHALEESRQRLRKSELSLARMQARFRAFKAFWPREKLQGDGNEGS